MLLCRWETKNATRAITHIRAKTGLTSERNTWWCYQIETFAVLLVLREGNLPVTSGFPSQKPLMRNFDALFALRLNKRLSRRNPGDLRSHRVHYDVTIMTWTRCAISLIKIIIIKPFANQTYLHGILVLKESPNMCQISHRPLPFSIGMNAYKAIDNAMNWSICRADWPASLSLRLLPVFGGTAIYLALKINNCIIESLVPSHTSSNFTQDVNIYSLIGHQEVRVVSIVW